MLIILINNEDESVIISLLASSILFSFDYGYDYEDENYPNKINNF